MSDNQWMPDKETAPSEMFQVVEMLVGCLTDSGEKQAQRLETMVGKMLEEQRIQLTTISSAFSVANREVVEKVTLLAETILLGRDSLSPNENLLMNSSVEEPSSDIEIDLNDLPEAARWAEEEEQRMMTQSPSSTPPRDLEET